MPQLLLMEEIPQTTWHIQNHVNHGINYQPQVVSWISSINSIPPVSPGHVLKGEAMYHSSPTKHTALHRLSPTQLRRSIPKPGCRMIPLPLLKKKNFSKNKYQKNFGTLGVKKKTPSSDPKKNLWKKLGSFTNQHLLVGWWEVVLDAPPQGAKWLDCFF